MRAPMSVWMRWLSAAPIGHRGRSAPYKKREPSFQILDPPCSQVALSFPQGMHDTLIRQDV